MRAAALAIPALALLLAACAVEFPGFQGASDAASEDAAGTDGAPDAPDARVRDAEADDARPDARDERPVDARVEPDAAADAAPDANACVPTDETCNGVDDDCDRGIDEADPAIGDPCVVPMPGPCGMGITECRAGRLDCRPGATPQPETCNHIDDDCDGQVDDDLVDNGRECDTGLPGVCGAGSRRCTEAGETCVPTLGDDEDCMNGTDDDCDGLTDEGCNCRPGPMYECGSDIGLCSRGQQICGAGATITGCQGAIGPIRELCNGEDDDCDGLTDETWALQLGNLCRIEAEPCPVDGVLVCDQIDPRTTRCVEMDLGGENGGEGGDGDGDDGAEPPPPERCGCPVTDNDDVRLCDGSATPTCTYGYIAPNDGAPLSCDDICAQAGGACDEARSGASCGNGGTDVECGSAGTPMHCVCDFL